MVFTRGLAQFPTLVLCEYVDFAVEGVGGFISRFGEVTIENQKAELPQTTAAAGNANAKSADYLFPYFHESGTSGNAKRPGLFSRQSHSLCSEQV